MPSAAPILCDLDGVVWLMHQPIEGSVHAIDSLRKAGHRVLFVTNNSFSIVSDQENTLAKIGIDAQGDVVTSSQAAGALLRKGDRVLLGGGPGAVEAIVNAGAILVGRSDDHIQGDSDAQKMNSESDQQFDQEIALAKIGIDAQGDVVTSSQAAGALLRKGDRVLLGGGPGAVEAIVNAGAILAGRSDDHIQRDSDAQKMKSESDQQFDQEIDVVMVGYHATFDYRGLTRLSHAVRNGARLIATNDDATYPTPHGLIPGGGSILAAVAAASGVEPIIAGKPHKPMADLVRQVLGVDDLSNAWMVGDRPSTDGKFAQTIGCRFAQVLTGISSLNDVSDDASSDVSDQANGDRQVFADLATFAKMIVGS